MVGVLCQGTLRAQDTVRSTYEPQTDRSATRLRISVSTPQSDALRDAIKRETERLRFAPTSVQQPAPQQRSWIKRHKVLAGILIGTGAFFAIWGGLIWSACANDGC